METEVKQKYDWAAALIRWKAEGRDILQSGSCPNCGGKSVELHRYGVVKYFCENGDLNGVGFGGPNTMSWAEAVHRESTTMEERAAADKAKTDAIEAEYQKHVRFLTS